MNFFEKNMKMIKNYHRFLYKALENEKGFNGSEYLESINYLETKDNDGTLVIEKDNSKIRLNSLYSPTNEAEIWAKQYNIINLNSLIIMFGLGTGAFTRAILERMKPDDSLFIYEPSKEIFRFVLMHFDLTDILSDTRISIGVENIDIFEFHENLFAIMDITNMNEPIICMHPYMDILFEESCLSFWKEIREAYIHVHTNINTIISFGKKEIENILLNTKFLKSSNTIWELKNYIKKDATAIIVSAGPSVEKQIDDLKKAKGKAIIFAVDRILDYLLDSGITPDFVVTLDPVKDLKYFSRRNDITIPLLCFMESNHDLLELHKGKKIICECNDFLKMIYADLKKMPPVTNSGPSVSTVALNICIGLGLKNIVLVGQDLAYADGKTHAGNVAEKDTCQFDVLVKGIDGELIESRSDWKSFIIWFEDMITLYPDVKVIDVKEKGAKIKGSVNIPLKEVIEKLNNGSISIGQDINNLESTFNEENMLYIKKYMEKNLSVLDQIVRKAKVGIRECDKLIKNNFRHSFNDVKEKEALKKLSRINQYIYNQPIYSLLEFMIKGNSSNQLVKIKQFSGDKNQDNLDTYEKVKNIYEILIDAVDYIKPLLEASIQEII